ncbi:Retrovirus-related Pol polyprotein from transposon TNT 1-94 [Eumeta japonica]|uniref:Retrovirus-related Pol polyprotein from transposon TNT 1-94 n=1 Tax=Eumeta variegata TaxID=151549 RepID=A0A4C1UCP4_EUMVA|nr:Retrovirus-related Pol polyprotein from transposon TNT 1-94 [Eumeta japonica]
MPLLKQKTLEIGMSLSYKRYLAPPEKSLPHIACSEFIPLFAHTECPTCRVLEDFVAVERNSRPAHVASLVPGATTWSGRPHPCAAKEGADNVKPSSDEVEPTKYRSPQVQPRGREDHTCVLLRKQPTACSCLPMGLSPQVIRVSSNHFIANNQKSIDARNAWIKTDRKAKSEVILAISSTELQHVRGCNTSREVWQKLASVYASKGPARKALLLKQLMLHKMSEGGDVRDHVNKFSDIVDRLGAMDIQVNKDLLSIMLLFSLPDSYEGFKCAIESRDELLRLKLSK